MHEQTKPKNDPYQDLRQSQAYKTYCADLEALNSMLLERFPNSSANCRRQACRDLWRDQACWGCTPKKGYECPKTTYAYWQIDKFECDANGNLYPRIKPCLANKDYETIIARRREELNPKK